MDLRSPLLSPCKTARSHSVDRGTTSLKNAAVNKPDQRPPLAVSTTVDVTPLTRPSEVTSHGDRGGLFDTGTRLVGFNAKQDVSGVRVSGDDSAPRLRRYDSPGDPPSGPVRVTLSAVEREMLEIKKQMEFMAEQAELEVRRRAVEATS